MDHVEFRRARDRLGLTQKQLGRRLGMSERSVKRMEAAPAPGKERYGASPPVVRIMRWLLDGDTPPESPEKAARKTPQDFRKARQALDLTQADLADILGVQSMTVTRYEFPPDAENARPPSPAACLILDWMLDGFEPPELAEVRERKNRR